MDDDFRIFVKGGIKLIGLLVSQQSRRVCSGYSDEKVIYTQMIRPP